ncbi:MAG: hypothetical protein AAFY08_01945 [Planctomycetota bacterium]
MNHAVDHFNFTRGVMRLVGVGLLVVLGWLIWLSVVAGVDAYQNDPTFWLIPLVIAITVLLACLFTLALTMTRAPRRAHLAICTVAGLLYGQVTLTLLLQQPIEAMVQPAHQEQAAWVVGWITFLALATMALVVEWKTSKAAGFVDADERWWQEGNIRGLCGWSALMLFFALGPSLPVYKEEATWLFKPDYAETVGSLGFLGLLAYCFFHGMVLPITLMQLTGVEIKPRPPKEKRRGFRFW